MIPCGQVGVAVHHYILIGGGAREGSMSGMGWMVDGVAVPAIVPMSLYS